MNGKHCLICSILFAVSFLALGIGKFLVEGNLMAGVLAVFGFIGYFVVATTLTQYTNGSISDGEEDS